MEWADPIIVRLTGSYLTGFGAFGWWHELAVTVDVRIDFAVNARRQLVLRRRPPACGWTASAHRSPGGCTETKSAPPSARRSIRTRSSRRSRWYFTLPPLARLTGTGVTITD